MRQKLFNIMFFGSLKGNKFIYLKGMVLNLIKNRSF